MGKGQHLWSAKGACGDGLVGQRLSASGVDRYESDFYIVCQRMNKYERLLYILNLVRTHRGLNAAGLARKCEVTERTIFRDITALSSANVPIYYDRGYKFLTGSFLPTLNFDLKEYLLTREALRTTPLKRLPEQRTALKSIEAKIDACLSRQVIEEVKYDRSEAILSVKERPLSAREALWYGQIERAIGERLVMEMDYESIDTGKNKRIVEPRFSICASGKFYFVGFCLLRNDYRTFRLSRIKKITLTRRRAESRPAIDPESYFQNSWTVFGGDVLDVNLEFSGRAARLVATGSYLSGEKKKRLAGGRLRYQAKVAGVAEIGRWIMGYGFEVKVIAPKQLRDWVTSQARGILKQNS